MHTPSFFSVRDKKEQSPSLINSFQPLTEDMEGMRQYVESTSTNLKNFEY
ncbi:hypothetical protein [Candidatus Nitrosocosmicus sp. R]